MQSGGSGSEDDDDLLGGLPVGLPDPFHSYASSEENVAGTLQKTAASNSNASLPRSIGSGHSGRSKSDEKVQNGAQAAKQMLQLTSKIQTATNLLYVKGDQAESSDDEDMSRKMSISKPPASDSEDDSSGSSMKSWGRPKPSAAKTDDDSDVEDYDLAGAEERLYNMLGSLKNEKRTEIMTSLNHFYSNRSATVQQELEELDRYEGEHIARELETADSLNMMQKTFEMKNVREVKVLMQASRTLAAGSKGELHKRQRFSRQAANESTQDEPTAEGDQARYDPDKDIADQPPWDVDHARAVWNHMNDKALKISGGRANATEVLEAMSVIQDGNLELETRASQAKAANETLQLAVDYLSKQVQGMLTEGAETAPEVPSEAVQACIDHLRQRVLDTVDLDGVVEGPDPDELEEEVEELQKLVAEQEKHMDAYRRQRERTLRLNQEMEDTKIDGGIVDDQQGGKGNIRKSTLIDPRMDQRLMSTAPSKASQALSKVRTVARNAAMLASLSKTVKAKRAEQEQEKDKEFKDDGNYDQDPKVTLLREHIKTKDEEILKAQALLTRMRREKRLLKYCSQKAQAGFDSFATDFNPPKPDDPVDSADDSDEPVQSNQTEGPADDSGTDEKASPVVATQEGRPEEPPSAAKPDSEESESTQQLAERKKNSPKRKAIAGAGKKTESSSAPKPPALLEKITEAEAAIDAHAEQLESELQSKLTELQAQLSTDMAALREQKAKSKVLRKEVKDLRKEFALMTNNDRSAPHTLEALTERIEAEAETEKRIRAQMAELESELQSQAQQLEEAKAEQENIRKNLAQGAAAEASEQLLQPRAQPTPPPEQVQDPTKKDKAEEEKEEKEQRPIQDNSSRPIQDNPSTPIQDNPSAAAIEPSESKPSLAETMLSMRRARALEATKQAAALVDPHESGTAKQSLDPGSLQHGEPSASQADRSQARQVRVSEDAAVAPKVPATPSKRGIAFPSVEVAQDVPETTAKRGIGFAAASVTPEDGETTKRGARFATADEKENSVDAKPMPEAKQRADSVREKSESLKKAESGDGAQQTLAELVQIQSKTEELRHEIADIDQKMKRLKQALKTKGGPPKVEVVKEIMGVTQAVDKVQPPPEYFSLKKDLKAQQEKIRSMRKKWWMDRRDFEAVVEKVRHQVGANYSGAHVKTSSGGSRSQPFPSTFTKLASIGFEGSSDVAENQVQRAASSFSAVAAALQGASALQAARNGGPTQAALPPVLSMQFSGRQTVAQPPGQADHPAPEAQHRRLNGVLSALNRSPAARGGPRQRFEQIRKAAGAVTGASDEIVRTPAQAAALHSTVQRAAIH